MESATVISPPSTRLSSRSVHSSFPIILMGKRELIALLKFVFLVSCHCCVALPRGAMGLYSVCDCGIS